MPKVIESPTTTANKRKRNNDKQDQRGIKDRLLKTPTSTSNTAKTSTNIDTEDLLNTENESSSTKKTRTNNRNKSKEENEDVQQGISSVNNEESNNIKSSLLSDSKEPYSKKIKTDKCVMESDTKIKNTIETENSMTESDLNNSTISGETAVSFF